MDERYEDLVGFMREQGITDGDLEGHVFHRYLFEANPLVKSQLLRLLTALVSRERPVAAAAELARLLAGIRAGHAHFEEARRLMQATDDAFVFFVQAFEAEADPTVRRRLAQHIVRYRAYGPAVNLLT